MMLKKQRNGILILFITLTVLLTGDVLYPASIFAAVFVHEAGHYLTARFLGVRLESVEFFPLGIRMKYDFLGTTVLKEVIVCLGGSAAGLLSVAVLTSLGQVEEMACMSFVLISLTLSIMNLLPIRNFDGGEVCEAILDVVFLPDVAYKISYVISVITVIGFWICTVCIETYFEVNLSLLTLSVYLIYSLF